MQGSHKNTTLFVFNDGESCLMLYRYKDGNHKMWLIDESDQVYKAMRVKVERLSMIYLYLVR